MKAKHIIMRLVTGVALFASIASGVSCMTTYDSYGRPVQSVDPGLAVAGIAAAGVLGYAAGNNNNDDDHHHHYRRGGYYGGGGRRYYR